MSRSVSYRLLRLVIYNCREDDLVSNISVRSANIPEEDDKDDDGVWYGLLIIVYGYITL